MALCDWLSRRAGCSVAGVPCVSDTCSITSTIDSFGKLSLNARLDPAGGLVCGTDADPMAGLRAQIYGNPAAVSPATLTECDSLLGVTTDGFLFARRPSFEIIIPETSVVDWNGGINGATGPQTANSINHTVVNNANCARLMIIKTQGRINFETRTGFGYSVDGDWIVDISGSQSDNTFHIAGQPSRPQSSTDTEVLFHQQAWTSVIFAQIDAGQTRIIKTYGLQLTSAQMPASGGAPDTEETKKIFTTAADKQGSNVLGFGSSMTITLLDLAPGNLA